MQLRSVDIEFSAAGGLILTKGSGRVGDKRQVQIIRIDDPQTTERLARAFNLMEAQS